MKLIKYILSLILAASLLDSCVTPFEPVGHEGAENILVIEGDINANGVTEVYLSRSQKLKDANKRSFLSGAIVWIESEKGAKYFANQTVTGKEVSYRTPSLNLDRTLKYKLCVSLQGGHLYESQLVPVLTSPPIKSIGFERDTVKKSVTFNVSTEDPLNSTKYYKWTYTEDWEFSSHIYTTYIYNPATFSIDELNYDKNIYYCWNKGSSTSILIASTTHLSSDKVEKMPLVSMGSTDDRISILYSIEVTQRAITQEAYQYWDNLKKNSDKVGGLFSPQPSEMMGNIKCISDPTQVVLGYISAGVTVSKRFFASHSEMKTYSYYHNCAIVEPETQSPPTAWSSLYQEGYMVADYDLGQRKTKWAIAYCVDCRFRGTKNKPSFWPNDHK